LNLAREAKLSDSKNGQGPSEAPPAELEASGSPLKGGEYVGKAPLGLN